MGGLIRRGAASLTLSGFLLLATAARGEPSDVSATTSGMPRPEGIEVAVRTGYALALGSLVAGTNLSDALTGVVPVWIDAGYRFPRVFLGVYGQYAWGTMVQGGAAGGAYIDSGGIRANTSRCGSLGQTCSGSDVKYGVEVQVHFASEQRVDPWVGYGIGMETLNVDAHGHAFGRSDFPYLSSTISFTAWSPAVLQAGADYKLPHLGVGPFVMMDVSRFVGVSLSDAAISQSETIRNSAAHEWLTFGMRGYFDMFGGTP